MSLFGGVEKADLDCVAVLQITLVGGAKGVADGCQFGLGQRAIVFEPNVMAMPAAIVRKGDEFAALVFSVLWKWGCY